MPKGSSRVMQRLQRANSAVVLSAIKVILQYMHEALDLCVPEVRAVHGGVPCLRMASSAAYLSRRRRRAPPDAEAVNSPLDTQVNDAEPELCYVALRNVNLIVQRDQRILENEIKIFFCRYNDPSTSRWKSWRSSSGWFRTGLIDQVLLELKRVLAGGRRGLCARPSRPWVASRSSSRMPPNDA